jgi:hypothetical protein
MTVDGNACCREDGAELGVPLLANDWKLGVDEAAGAVCSSISSARSARDPSDAESLLGELSRWVAVPVVCFGYAQPPVAC